MEAKPWVSSTLPNFIQEILSVCKFKKESRPIYASAMFFTQSVDKDIKMRIVCFSTRI